jgi:hypothetical protein
MLAGVRIEASAGRREIKEMRTAALLMYSSGNNMSSGREECDLLLSR